jgi:Myb-like DNA-binding domain
MRLVERIDEQYKSNNIFLEQAKSGDSKDATNFKTSYIKCGAPFFKDALSYPAPYNEDYKYRKNIAKEFFPFDLPPSSSRWKTKEKVALINGVKNQMISHIKSKQSRRLCEDSRKTRGKLQKLKFISHNKDLEQSPILDIYESIQKDYPDFAVNWNLISFDDLQSAHSVSECMGMWYSYLRPDLNREPFSEQEDVMIANAVVESNFNDWNELASMLNNRSSLQAFVHFHATFSRLCPANVRWTEKEDFQLIEGVERYSLNGVVNWAKVGQILPTRNKTQCYNRYLIIVKSRGLKKGVFSRHEDRIILDYVSKMGEKAFNQIPKGLLPGRTSIQIKNHFNVALKHQGTVHPWTREEDQQLVEYVEKKGTNNWSGIAAILGTHNRISCRTRYLTISKFLAKNPEAILKDVPCKTKMLTAVQKAKAMSDDEEEGERKFSNTKNFGEKTFATFKRQNPQLYAMLRTAFNYDLSDREVNADSRKLMILLWLFKADDHQKVLTRKAFMFPANQLAKLREATAIELDQKLVREMMFATKHTQFLMPPNYNTAVGLRAITIKLQEHEQDEDLTVTDPTPKYRKALVDFQKLYFSLFYWTAMLSKVDKDELNEIHFQKYPRTEMSASEIFKHFHKRKIPINSGFQLSQSFDLNKANPPKVYPPAKKQKIEADV